MEIMTSKASTLTDVRCANCNRLLARFGIRGEGVIQIQCRCKTMNVVKQTMSKDAEPVDGIMTVTIIR